MSNYKKPTAMEVKEEMAQTAATPTKVGTFAVFDSGQLKGLRINIEKIRNYAMNGDDSIQISYDNSGNTVLKFATTEQAKEALERLDSFCL